MNGRVTYSEHPYCGDGGEGMSFGGKLRVITDGNLTNTHDNIEVTCATYVTIYSTFATNFNVEKFDIDDSICYRAKLSSIIDKICAASYEEIKEKHIIAHKKRFDSVQFSLDAPAFEDMPTDERLEELQDGEKDDDLFTLYYNFGRYLLTESSGKNATLPANLQGI